MCVFSSEVRSTSGAIALLIAVLVCRHYTLMTAGKWLASHKRSKPQAVQHRGHCSVLSCQCSGIACPGDGYTQAFVFDFFGTLHTTILFHLLVYVCVCKRRHRVTWTPCARPVGHALAEGCAAYARALLIAVSPVSVPIGRIIALLALKLHLHARLSTSPWQEVGTRKEH
jgi:hypothetical protein